LKERNQELEAELNRLREQLDPKKTGSPPDAASASASALSTPNEDVRILLSFFLELCEMVWWASVVVGDNTICVDHILRPRRIEALSVFFLLDHC